MSAKPCRVLFLSATGRIGGAERSLIELIGALPRERVEPYVACPSDGPMLEMLRKSGVRAYEVGFRRYRRTLHPFILAGQIKALFLSSVQVGRLCDKNDIQAIHANTDSTAIVAWEVCRTGRWPFIWHARDLRPLGRIGRLLGARAERVVAISETVASHLVSQRVPREKIRLVMNGIDMSRFDKEVLAGAREDIRRELGVPPEAIVLASAGMFVPWKRHEDFLSLVYVIRKNRSDVYGLLAGDDLFEQNEEYAASLRKMIEDLALRDAVRLTGYREDVPRLLAASDIFVSTSEREPFGRSIVEAMAAGLPVVSTFSGAKGEIIEDGRTGFLVPMGRAGAMVEACEKLILDGGLRKSFSEAGCARARDLFDVKRTAREIADIYAEITGDRDGR